MTAVATASGPVDASASQTRLTRLLQNCQKKLSTRDVPFIQLSEEHTTSESRHTREPNVYDRHLPTDLQLQRVRLDGHWGDVLESDNQYRRLCFERLGQSTSWETLPSNLWSSFSAGLTAGFPPANTHVSKVQGIAKRMDAVLDKILNLVSMSTACREDVTAVADLYSQDAFPYVCDLLMQRLDIIGSATSAALAESVIAIANTHPDYECLNGSHGRGSLILMEYKNILAGDPRVYIATFLLAAATYLDRFLWPESHCANCDKHAWAHQKSLENMFQFPKQPALSGSVIPAEDLSKLLAVVDQSYKCLTEWDQKYSRVRHCSTTGIKVDSVQAGTEEHISSLLNSVKRIQAYFKFPDHANSVEMEKHLQQWLIEAHLILVQVWSQMMRHDVQYCLLSTGAVTWLIRRDCRTSTAYISPLMVTDANPHLLATLGGVVFKALDYNKDQAAASQQSGLGSNARRNRRKPNADGAPDQDDSGTYPSKKSKTDKSSDAASKKHPAPSCSIGLFNAMLLAFNSETVWSSGYSYLQRIGPRSIRYAAGTADPCSVGPTPSPTPATGWFDRTKSPF